MLRRDIKFLMLLAFITFSLVTGALALAYPENPVWLFPAVLAIIDFSILMIESTRYAPEVGEPVQEIDPGRRSTFQYSARTLGYDDYTPVSRRHEPASQGSHSTHKVTRSRPTASRSHASSIRERAEEEPERKERGLKCSACGQRAHVVWRGGCPNCDPATKTTYGGPR